MKLAVFWMLAVASVSGQDLRNLAPVRNGSVAPLNAVAYQNTSSISGDTALFRYAAADGWLEYRWQKPRAGDGLLGTLTCGRNGLAAE